jgi:sialate O-acetylesterase
MSRILTGVLLLLLCSSRAPLKLHGLFGDGMVLQRDIACPVWGTASPGEEIMVRIAGQKKTTRAGDDGRWSLKLDPLAAGGPHELTVNDHTFRDVLVGEVWLASGGSNMDMPVKAAQIAKTEPDDSPIPMIRFFVAPRGSEEAPQKDVVGAWKTNRSDAVADVSAVAYYFAREIQHRLKVPVGFLQATVESSLAEKWISKSALQANPSLRFLTVPQSMNQNNFNIANAWYLESVRKAEEAKKRGDPVPEVRPRPAPPGQMSVHYNAMVAPLVPYAIRGAVFYQGEAEYWRTGQYRAALSALIQDWRSDWGQGDFPFGFVQLANLGPRTAEPEETALPRFRDAQTQVLSVPNTGMVVTVDIGDARNDQPRNKEEVGRRLALWADAKVYGKSDLVFSGPLYDSIKIETSKVRIKFKNIGGGLKAGGDKLVGFQMAGDFRKFFWANAAIEGDTVVVWCDDVKWPAAVRYAYADNPECNLYNSEGLPASPFRTDNW